MPPFTSSHSTTRPWDTASDTGGATYDIPFPFDKFVDVVAFGHLNTNGPSSILEVATSSSELMRNMDRNFFRLRTAIQTDVDILNTQSLKLKLGGAKLSLPGVLKSTKGTNWTIATESVSQFLRTELKQLKQIEKNLEKAHQDNHLQKQSLLYQH